MGQVVYLARDGKAISRPVQTGLAHQGFVAVSGDLQAGDLAVVRGNERLRDGQAIRIIRKHQ
jgi:membrane fusion protein (multidrug efflux system)